MRTTVGKGLVRILDHPKDYGKQFSSRINRNKDNDKFRVLGSGLSTERPKTTLNTHKHLLNKQLSNNLTRKPKSGKLRKIANQMETGQSRQRDNKTHHQSTWIHNPITTHKNNPINPKEFTKPKQEENLFFHGRCRQSFKPPIYRNRRLILRWASIPRLFDIKSSFSWRS